MAKLVTCDYCGRDMLCKPSRILREGEKQWLCEDCYEAEDYVKPKENKRIEYDRYE